MSSLQAPSCTLTPAQRRVLDAVSALTVDWPTTSVRDVARTAGLSTSTVQAHIDNLQRLGLVARQGNRKPGIRLVGGVR